MAEAETDTDWLIDVEAYNGPFPRWLCLVNRHTVAAAMQRLVTLGATRIGIIPFGTPSYADVIAAMRTGSNGADVTLYFFHLDASDYADLHVQLCQQE